MALKNIPARLALLYNVRRGEVEKAIPALYKISKDT
jgi:hypothetical protein